MHMFKTLIDYIEQNIHNKINMEEISRVINISPAHLHRLFTFAYGMTIAEYIRRRKLADSLEMLLKSDFSILEIALVYGFEYEQSFARAFKAEFGMTPGKYRKNHPILNIVPPIRDFGTACEDGVLFGPEIVMVPELLLVGVEHVIPYCDSAWMAPKVALDFWDNRKDEISTYRSKEVYYGLTHHLGSGYDYSYYTTALEVKNMQNIPESMKGDAFGGYPCVKFHYVGQHHYRELSELTAEQMYRAIFEYYQRVGEGPAIYLEKIDQNQCDEEFCLMEWFAPVSGK